MTVLWCDGHLSLEAGRERSGTRSDHPGQLVAPPPSGGHIGPSHLPASLGLSPGSSGSQAWLPVRGGEREKIINAGLHPVPLGRQVVHLIPVDLPGRYGGTDQEEQEEEQKGEVVSAMRISSLVSGDDPTV